MLFRREKLRPESVLTTFRFTLSCVILKKRIKPAVCESDCEISEMGRTLSPKGIKSVELHDNNMSSSVVLDEISKVFKV